MQRKAWKEEDIKAIKKYHLYTPGYIFQDILKRSYSSIVGKIKNLGLRSNFKKDGNYNKPRPTLNDAFFEKPNLLNCYYAGFIAADGCINDISSGQKMLILHLHLKDLEVLENLKKELRYNGNIYLDKRQTGVSLRITSDKLCADLYKNFNITPRKSLTLKPPKGLTKKQTLAFIVGYIDGDGYIGTQQNQIRITIVGTKLILKWISKKLNLKQKVSKVSNHNCYSLVIVGNLQVPRIFREAFYLAVPKLKRKWDKLKEYLR